MSQRQYLNSLKCEVLLEIKVELSSTDFFLIREEKTLQEI